MNTKQLIALFAVSSLAVAPLLGQSSQYTPHQTTVTKLAPFSGSYEMTLAAPADLKPPKNGNSTWPITVTSTATLQDGPASPVYPSVVITPATTLYQAAGESKTFTVEYDVPQGVAPGTYQYNLQGKNNASGWGWGHASATLIIVVSEPPAAVDVDTTAPIVTVEKPTAGSQYTFGASIPVKVIATEDGIAGSTIETLQASYNAQSISLTLSGIGTTDATGEGAFTPGKIGTYTITGTATSPGGEGEDSEDVSVNYDATWLPPISLGKTSKGGSTIPIKFCIKDANGNYVIDRSVKIAVYEVSSSGEIKKFECLLGDGSSAVRIDESTGQYIANFQTEAGIHNYRVDVFFEGIRDDKIDWILTATKQFSVR